MLKFKTCTLEGLSQPGSFQTKRVSIKLDSKLFKLNFGLEETDGKLLFTLLKGNYWNQNLRSLHMKYHIQESLSVVFFFFRVLFITNKTFSAVFGNTYPDINTRYVICTYTSLFSEYSLKNNDSIAIHFIGKTPLFVITYKSFL